MDEPASQTNLPDARLRLVEVMARLAVGDGAAFFILCDEFEPYLAATVRRILRRLNVQPDADLVSELVIETAIVINDTAGSWNPDGGAKPWVWAEKRIAAMVSRFVGQHHDSLDLDAEENPYQPVAAPLAGDDDCDRRTHGASDDVEVLVLRSLAAQYPVAALLDTGMASALSMRERAVLLAYEALKVDGDPSPANTLSREWGLSPANVRQIVKRAKTKVRNLVTTDERYGAIRDLAILR